LPNLIKRSFIDSNWINSQDFFENDSQRIVVVVHRTFSDFLGGQVAIDGLDVDEMFQKNPHDFGVF